MERDVEAQCMECSEHNQSKVQPEQAVVGREINTYCQVCSDYTNHEITEVYPE